MFENIPLNRWVLINGTIINVSSIDMVTPAQGGCAILFKRAERLYFTDCTVSDIWQVLEDKPAAPQGGEG